MKSINKVMMYLVASVCILWGVNTSAQTESICCSNVIFIPGLESTRLERQLIQPWGTTVHRAWEPFTNDDVRALYLDDMGRSIQNIKVSTVMHGAYGLKNIYADLFDTLSLTKDSGAFNDWKPIGYDWRMFAPDIVTEHPGINGEMMVDVVLRMASTSKTGKVSLLAHSTGGLVAKMLVYKLEELGLAYIIDKVVMVGTPQLGTPQALSAILHGEGQAILGGMTMREYVAREFGQNMLGLFSLLPSSEYFNRIIAPVMTFAGDAVGSYGDYVDFLTGISGKRTQPDIQDLKNPTILSMSHIAKSEWLHDILDVWDFPDHIQVMAIAGWGIPTTSTIEYSSSSPRVKKIPHGDGTVMAQSAVGLTPQRLFFNQGLFNFDLKKKTQHVDIMETKPIRDYIAKAFSTSIMPHGRDVSTYFSSDIPKKDFSWMKWITISVHSPVEIEVVRDNGDRVMREPLFGNPYSEIGWEENTLGSFYSTIGDEKYVTVPADGTYHIQLSGTDVGTFTFQIQKFVGENMTEVGNVIYADLPVTPLMKAHTTITGLSFDSELSIDVDGDGTTDIQTYPTNEIQPGLHLLSFKKIIMSLGLSKKLEQKLLQRVDKIELKITKKKDTQAIKKLTKFKHRISSLHWNKHTLTEEHKLSLLQAIEDILVTLE